MENVQIINEAYVESLKTLQTFKNENIKKAADSILDEAQQIIETSKQLLKDNSVLRIGVVGQVKAGKSSFLNSLFFDGENVLPRASTPMTAGLTVLRYGEENVFEVEYYNKKEWATFETNAAHYDKQLQDIIAEMKSERPDANIEDLKKFAEGNMDDELKSAKELVEKCTRVALSKIEPTSVVDRHSFSGIRDLQDVLETYVGANGKFTSVVKSLTINLHDDRLKDVQIVDTPGVNDPVVSREQRTREFLRGCHGVFFLSFSSHFFDSTDVSFLSERIGSQGIGTVVLIASKFDSVLQDIGNEYKDNLGEALEVCRGKLRGQYENNMRNADYNGDDPIFDMSSGIGYSIYKKPESKWDATESHVVKQMKRFYPSYFSSEEDIKDTFLSLANMDTMQQKYLDGVFKNNKDKIIKQKVDAFTQKSTENFGKKVNEQSTRLTHLRDALNGQDIEKLKDSQKAMQKAVEHIKSNFETIVKTLQDKCEIAEKKCMNEFNLNSVSVKTTQVSENVKRFSTSFLQRNRDVQVEYSTVNINGTVTDVIDKLEKKIAAVQRLWEQCYVEITDKLVKSIQEKVKDYEKDNIDFDGAIFDDIVTETVSSLRNTGQLDFSSFFSDCRRQTEDVFQGIDVVVVNRKSEEDHETKRRYKEAGDESIKRARMELVNLTGAFTTDLRTKLHKENEKSADLLVNRKSQMVGKMTENVDTYIAQLTKELGDKEAQLKMYDEALTIINQYNS